MLIAGNWKMNTDVRSAADLARDVARLVGSEESVHTAVCPPFVQLAAVGAALEGSNVRLGAQNMHFEDSGAFTGEVSAAMLKSVGCRHVILGHSERRQYFGETDALVNRKVVQAMAHGLIPIVCFGETLEQREKGDEKDVVRTQVEGALADVSPDDVDALVLAYEPVWAIGTGVTATPDQAQSMHAFVRELLTGMYGEELARGLHVLYGGSMKPGNAGDLLPQPDIDGGLIGGASLKAEAFAELVQIASSLDT